MVWVIICCSLSLSLVLTTLSQHLAALYYPKTSQPCATCVYAPALQVQKSQAAAGTAFCMSCSLHRLAPSRACPMQSLHAFSGCLVIEAPHLPLSICISLVLSLGQEVGLHEHPIAPGPIAIAGRYALCQAAVRNLLAAFPVGDQGGSLHPVTSQVARIATMAG